MSETNRNDNLPEKQNVPLQPQQPNQPNVNQANTSQPNVNQADNDASKPVGAGGKPRGTFKAGDLPTGQAAGGDGGRNRHFAEQQTTFVPGANVNDGATMHTAVSMVNNTATVKSVLPVRKKLPYVAAFENQRLLALVLLLLLGVWSYFPAIQLMINSWYMYVDYSHGYLVAPLCVFFLYVRRGSYPGTTKRLCWYGLIPIVLCIVMRARAAIRFEDAIEAWSMIFWIIGTVWFLYGTRVIMWALPSLLFLMFMIPLPYSLEYDWRQELQKIAATVSATMLQTLGEPAVRLQNTIHIGNLIIGVESACSGLRFLISFFALGYGAVLLMRRPWWQNLFVFVMVLPIAILSNACRITLTALMLLHAKVMLLAFTKEKNVSAFADEVSGIAMIFVAMAVFILMLWYLGKIFRRVSMFDVQPVRDNGGAV
ncbi:MAG: exosortase/archaeosortase family protein [Planctomycetaceae bacterium]|nr:exosortase/archaeosortase family protein [Planctomycetaceae bacterium]